MRLHKGMSKTFMRSHALCVSDGHTSETLRSLWETLLPPNSQSCTSQWTAGKLWAQPDTFTERQEGNYDVSSHPHLVQHKYWSTQHSPKFWCSVHTRKNEARKYYPSGSAWVSWLVQFGQNTQPREGRRTLANPLSVPWRLPVFEPKNDSWMISFMVLNPNPHDSIIPHRLTCSFVTESLTELGSSYNHSHEEILTTWGNLPIKAINL